MLRAALLAVAAGIAVLGFALARRRDRAVAPIGAPYVCPMHLEVTANAPRECPICGMALVEQSELRREGDQPAAAGSAEGVAASHLLANMGGPTSWTELGFNPMPVRRHVLRQEPYVAAWLENAQTVAALVYNDVLPALVAGEHALFLPTAAPGTVVDLELSREPVAPWDRSTSIVRFSAQTTALRDGTPGWVKLDPKSRESVVVPAMSVMQSGEGPYVLVFTPARGTLVKRPIQIGKTFSGMTAIVSGVSPRELVASMNTFFWDAERRLHADPPGARSP
jgi:hypothetical protein